MSDSAISTPPVSHELVDAFARDGVVCVRGVLDPDEVATAERAIEAVLDRPGGLAQVASDSGDPAASPRTSAGGPRFPRSSSWPSIHAHRRSRQP